MWRIMKSFQDVYEELQEQLRHEARSMRSKKQAKKKLASYYHQYLDLEDEIHNVHHRMSIKLGLFGPERVAETVKGDERLAEALKSFQPPMELREKLTLWRAIREFLRMAGESTVGDIQEFLQWIGLPDFTRQAVESALQNHDDIFEITKRGRERYVALK